MVQVAGRMLVVAALIALAGCQTPSGSFCTVANPIRPSASTIATMADKEVRDAAPRPGTCFDLDLVEV